MHMPILEAIDVRKQYGRLEALRGVSLEVQPGEMFGLLGPNGAGKSTFLQIAAALMAPSGGRLRLFDRDLDRDDRATRLGIGLATQDLALYGELSARENLAFFGKLYGLTGADLSLRVNEVLELTALTDRADDRAGTFSGGMKRRLNLGIAIVHRPRLLYLDEPTTGVDPQSRNHIFERVRELNRNGLTVIYTSHYMEEVQALCPRIAIMDHGRVIACDQRERLLRLLDCSVDVRIDGDPATLAREIDGRHRIDVLPHGLRFHGEHIGELTVQAIDAVRLAGGRAIEVIPHEPTLEQVFLKLTDTAMRD